MMHTNIIATVLGAVIAGVVLGIWIAVHNSKRSAYQSVNEQMKRALSKK